MTLFLSALVALGVQPGAQLVIAQGSLVWTLMWALALANVVGALMLAMLGRWLAYLTFASGNRLVPFAIVFVVVGALFGTGDLRVLGVLFLLSIVGLLLKVAEWPRAPFAIGLVLGSVTERALNQAWALQGAAFLLRPGAIILLASIAASVAFYFARPSRLSSTPGVCPVLGESAHRRRACRHALRHLCEHDGDCVELPRAGAAVASAGWLGGNRPERRDLRPATSSAPIDRSGPVRAMAPSGRHGRVAGCSNCVDRARRHSRGLGSLRRRISSSPRASVVGVRRARYARAASRALHRYRAELWYVSLSRSVLAVSSPRTPPACVLVNVGFDGPLRNLIKRWDGALAPYLQVASYQSFLVRGHVPTATYVFSDLDRVPPADRDDVIRLWDTLRDSGRRAPRERPAAGPSALRFPSTPVRTGRQRLQRLPGRRGLEWCQVPRIRALRTRPWWPSDAAAAHASGTGRGASPAARAPRVAVPAPRH